MRQQLEQARAVGVSLSRLHGIEPAEHTEYHYDDDGRLIGSTTTREPEFGPTDVDWLMALSELEADEGPHGHLMSDATSPEADPSDPDSPWKFVAGIPVRSPEGDLLRAPVVDFAEKARLDALDRLRKHDPDPMNGVIMPVFRVPRVKRKHRPQPGTTP